MITSRERIECPDLEMVQLARVQSQSLAEGLATAMPPFDWARVERKAVAQRILPLRTVAFAASFVMLLASGTWALVRPAKMTPAQDDKPALWQQLKQRVWREAPAAVRRAPRSVQQRPVVVERQVMSPAVVKRKRPRQVVQPVAPVAKVPQSRRFRDEVIIVAPRARIGPLFSPEEYKRRRGRR